MRAVGDDAAVVEQHDAVGERDRRGPVGDDDRRPALHHLGERGPDLVLLGRVDRRGRVVEDQHARVGEHRARDRDALPLPARQRVAVLADDRVVALGQLADELVGARELRGAHARLRIGASGSANAMLLRTRVGEQERVLEHDARPHAAARAGAASRTSAPSMRTWPASTS